jgi:hypothetical protein
MTRRLFPIVTSLSVALGCWLVASPSFALDFFEQPYGTTSTPQHLPLINGTNLPNNGPPTPMTINSVAVSSNEFVVGGTCMAGLVLAPGESCTVAVAFAPLGSGQRTATVTIDTSFGLTLLEVDGTGVDPDFSRAVTHVVEYYNADSNAYVMTSTIAEITLLDYGAIKGWVRTGETFDGFQSDSHLASVCRMYAVTQTTSSHWYFWNLPLRPCGSLSASSFSLSALVEYVEEDPDVFSFLPPSYDEGWCPYGTTALYGFYDGVIGHRYTTDLAARESMIAQGWIPEGYGPGVFACVSS